jgi:predicted alpha/beta superfamily hydrolase
MKNTQRLKLFLFVFILACGCMAHIKKQPGDIILPYTFAKDSFLIRVTNLATNARPSDIIHIVYYPDQSIKSGKDTEDMIEKYRTTLLGKNYIFVGIGHFGYFRPKRRRDFITPSVPMGSGYAGMSADYGQADSFYYFLKNTIIPLVEKDYAQYTIERSFIGHSLGGLFATYLLVNDDSLFTNLYALSPALWIDDYHVLNYESSKQEQLKRLKKNFWLSCGTAETINRIKAGVEKMQDSLELRKYPDIYYTVKMYSGESHNSSVKPALEDIFTKF